MFKSVFLLIFLFPFFLSAQILAPGDSDYIFRSLDAALQTPDQVYKLNLSHKKITKFPEGIFQLKNLRELDLSHNKIDTLPAQIGQLTFLEKLNLSNNKLESLPDEIGNLTKLTYLGLNRNVIEELPVTIGKLENLETLELWDNELYKIPDEIGNLKNLKVLELRGILFSDEEGARLDSLLPNTKVLMSPTCNCKF
jgi:Leucine-rich repeat (LRR) protein